MKTISEPTAGLLILFTARWILVGWLVVQHSIRFRLWRDGKIAYNMFILMKRKIKALFTEVAKGMQKKKICMVKQSLLPVQ